MNRGDRRARRRLVGGLAAAPLLLGISRRWASAYADTPAAAVAVDKVLNVADLEALAKSRLPPAHFGYIATGVDDDRTVAWNHDAYSHLQIRSRRFVDVSKIDTSRKVFGQVWKYPFYFSAISSMRAFHPDAEVAVARAAASRDVQLMLSTYASCTVEDVIAARKGPVWHQLYATNDWKVTEALVRRAEKAGCTAIVLTVDDFFARNNETLKRSTRKDGRNCAQCHSDGHQAAPMFAGIDMSKVTEDRPTNMSGDFLARLRRLVTVKLLVKGIVTAEDAVFAMRAGVDGIVVSNHGGRSEETLRSTIECLPEVVAAVGGKIPVFIDGGIRRGTDIFKALALGATAVGIGRPLAWGLAAYGQSGVEAVNDIFARELHDIMFVAGTASVKSIDGSRVLWAKHL